MADPIKKVPFLRGTYVSIKRAIELTGIPHETIRRWADLHGIGRKHRDGPWTRWEWDISLPGLRMRIAKDFDALEEFRQGHESSSAVTKYMVTEKEAVK